jgi:hypothetical protein
LLDPLDLQDPLEQKAIVVSTAYKDQLAKMAKMAQTAHQ